MSDAKLTVDAIAGLQNEIATQREVICNLNAMNDKLKAKLDGIEQIVKDHDNDNMAEDYWYIDKIREVLEKAGSKNFTIEINGNGNKVLYQSPEKNSRIQEGQTVRLFTN